MKKFEMEENEEKEKKNTLDKEALCECLKTIQMNLKTETKDSRKRHKSLNKRNMTEDFSPKALVVVERLQGLL